MNNDLIILTIEIYIAGLASPLFVYKWHFWQEILCCCQRTNIILSEWVPDSQSELAMSVSRKMILFLFPIPIRNSKRLLPNYHNLSLVETPYNMVIIASSREICLSMRQISLRKRVEIAWFTRDNKHFQSAKRPSSVIINSKPTNQEIRYEHVNMKVKFQLKSCWSKRLPF